MVDGTIHGIGTHGTTPDTTLGTADPTGAGVADGTPAGIGAGAADGTTHGIHALCTTETTTITEDRATTGTRDPATADTLRLLTEEHTIVAEHLTAATTRLHHVQQADVQPTDVTAAAMCGRPAVTVQTGHQPEDTVTIMVQLPDVHLQQENPA